MFAVEQRTSAAHVDLFNLASLVDFKVKEGGQSQTRVHEKRMGDRDAAQSMLAIKPSSFATDVAPTWLVSEAATYSQSEHKRRERARAQTHGGFSANASWSKGGGKGGKDRKGGKDKKKGWQRRCRCLYSRLRARQKLGRRLRSSSVGWWLM